MPSSRRRTTTPQDLALQMKVSAAYLLDPGFRPEAAGEMDERSFPIIEKQVDAQPEAVAGVPPADAARRRRSALRHCPRRRFCRSAISTEARAALAPVIASAPIEITIVGDVDENAAIAAVASTFGALPERKLSDFRRTARVRKASLPLRPEPDPPHATRARRTRRWSKRCGRPPTIPTSARPSGSRC